MVNSLSAISYKHTIQNMHDPTKSFIIANALKGFRRNNPQKDSRLPITIDILQKIPAILQHICSSSYELLLFKAVFILAFFGLLRVSEVVFNDGSPVKTINDEDVKIVNNKLHVRIRYSK